jgi:hypothetical protein
MAITNPAVCDVCSVIQFLNVKNICPAAIHRQLVEIYGKGMCVSGVVYLVGEGQTCTVKCDLGACLSSPRICLCMWKQELHEVFPYVSLSGPTRLSQISSSREKFVPDGFQECSQMSTSSYDWLNDWQLTSMMWGLSGLCNIWTNAWITIRIM